METTTSPTYWNSICYVCLEKVDSDKKNYYLTTRTNTSNLLQEVLFIDVLTLPQDSKVCRKCYRMLASLLEASKKLESFIANFNERHKNLPPSGSVDQEELHPNDAKRPKLTMAETAPGNGQSDMKSPEKASPTISVS